MICRPLLPLERQVYGSADAGATVLTTDEQFNDAMRVAGTELHLSAHFVTGKVIFTAGGI